MRYDPLHAIGVQFVKYVVEKEQRTHAGGFAEKFILGETQGYGECLALALRAGSPLPT